MNFFKSVLKSIKDLDKYEDFACELPKEAFKYLFKLVLIFVVIVSVFYSYKIGDSLRNIYTSLKDTLPEFSYAEGELTVNSEEPIILKQYENVIGKIIIDDDVENIEKYNEEIKNSNFTIGILKNKIVIVPNNVSGQVVYNYKEIIDVNGITEFTKQEIVNYVEGINIVSIYCSIYFIIFVYLFIIYFISILLDVFLLAILAYIVSRASRIRLKFAPSFNIAVHSITLPVLLNLIYIIVNLLTGFKIKYFQFMYNTISYIYIIVAVLMIKTDFINRQMELMKIAEEQEKVREEMKKQKEEQEKKKEEEKQDKDKKPEENKKRKNKQEKDDNLEEGVNPSVIEEKQ